MDRKLLITIYRQFYYCENLLQLNYKNNQFYMKPLFIFLFSIQKKYFSVCRIYQFMKYFYACARSLY